MPRPFCCPKCSRRAFTLVKLIQHIGLIHSHEADFTITCGLNNCPKTFSKYESFRRHVYRKHKHTVLPLATADDETVVDDEDVVDEQVSSGAAANPTTAPNMNELLLQFRENLFSFVLKCREKNHLPQTVQHELLQDVNRLFTFFKENYDAFLKYHLEKNGFDLGACPELQEILQSPDFFSEASKHIKSPYLFKEYCKSKFEMTEPVEYLLRDSSGHKIGSYSYVPICDVLRKYCSHEDVWDCLQTEPKS